MAHFCVSVDGSIVLGLHRDSLDHRKLYWVAALLMATAMLILQGEPSIWVLAVGVVCVGLAGGGILPLMGLIFGARFGVASFGRVMGFAMLGFTVGATGPLLAGWVYDLTGSYDLAFLLFLASILLAVIAMRWLPDAPQLTASIR